MSDIEAILAQNRRMLEAKNIKPLIEALKQLPEMTGIISFEKAFTLSGKIDSAQKEKIVEFAHLCKPWRKGPFSLFGIYIDSEWDSSIKYSLIENALNIEGKSVADVGCNNGYYMFKMLEKNPKSLIGFDPSAIFKVQFEFINRYAKTDIIYEMLGVEELPLYPQKFDVILCLGVIYHRPDPIGAIKALAKSLQKDGEIIVDTIYIDGDDEMALVPQKSYAKMPNVYFIPTIKAFENMLRRGGFKEIELLKKRATDGAEQRKTEWVDSLSLEDFLDARDSSKTIEGYPAPKRAYFRCRR